jgi:hypothetical protein
MEATFASAKNQYKMNYVQHFLTNEPKYKTAYEVAQKTMDDVLSKAPPPHEHEKLKPIKEVSVARQNRGSSPASIPSQTWKYWTLFPLLLVSFGLSMF